MIIKIFSKIYLLKNMEYANIHPLIIVVSIYIRKPSMQKRFFINLNIERPSLCRWFTSIDIQKIYKNKCHHIYGSSNCLNISTITEQYMKLCIYYGLKIVAQKL